MGRIKAMRRAVVIGAAFLPALALAADPQIASFVDSPDPVLAGALYTYSVRVDNLAPDAASGVKLTVSVPSGATYVSATSSPAGTSCALKPSSVTDVECVVGAVGGNGLDTRTVTLTWKALGPGPTTIGATATLTADADDSIANNVQSQNTTVVSAADLSIAAVGTPNPVVGGATISYALTVQNLGPNSSGNIVLTDNLPPASTFQAASGTGWSCTGPVAQVLTCTHTGTHLPNASLPVLTITATVTASSGNITNSASVAPSGSGGTPDPDNSNNTATTTTAVLPGADVQITKTVTSAVPATAGLNTTFKLAPRNAGPAPAASVVVSDTLPTGWTLVSATPSAAGWTCTLTGNALACTRPTMPVDTGSGATNTPVDITVVATAPDNATVGTGTSYTNTATITTTSTDPNLGNNTSSVTVLVRPDGADLSITKTKSPNPVALGGQLTSAIVVKNNGPRVATGPVQVVESLDGETYVGITSSPGWSCSANITNDVVTCTNANAGGLAVNATLTLRTLTQAARAGTVNNTACVGGSVPAGSGVTPLQPTNIGGDPLPGNDCTGAVGSNSTAIRPDLTISKTTSTPIGGDKIVSASEASVTYTVVGRNNSSGSDAATGIVITDTVPAFISGRTTINSVTATASAGSTATFNCAVSGATITCTQNGGSLKPGETVSVPITVNRPMSDGSFTNTASITNTAEGDPDPTNNSATDTVQIDPIADVQLTGKTVTPAAVKAGENATYVISFKNNGPSTAAGITVVDAFNFPAGDAGLTVVSISTTKGSCALNAGDVLKSGGATAFTCTVGSMVNGETQSITLVTRPNWQTGNAVRTFGNTATIATTTAENPAGGDNGNNSLSASLTVNGAAVDLLVNQTDDVDPIGYLPANSFAVYQVRINSTGPSYATGVKITQSMVPPAGKRARFVCDVTAAGGSTCNATSLCTTTNVTSGSGVAIPDFTCNLPAGSTATGAAVGDLAANQNKTIYLRYEFLDAPDPINGDVFNHTVAVSSNEPDTQSSNNTALEKTTVRPRIDLGVTKVTDKPIVDLREPFNWTVTVSNAGPADSQQTDITDTLPAGTEVTGTVSFSKTSPAGTGTCTVAGSTLSCALGKLDAGASASFVIPSRVVTYPASGTTLTNTVTVDTTPSKTGGVDTNTANNTASASITVRRASLSGTVFQDRDRAGSNGGVQQVASEPGIAGVSLALTGTDAYGNAVSLTTTTNASGVYTFSNLSAANGSGYTVTETQPSGYMNGPVDPPTSGGSAPSAGGSYSRGGVGGNSAYSGIAVASNASATNYNFPELRLPSLSGLVYIDLNANSAYNAGIDTPISGATVRLLNAADNSLVATTTTNSSGAYTFTGLDPLIVYSLEEPLPSSPAGLRNGPVNPGLINGIACAAGCIAQADTPSVDTDRIANIDLSAGTDGTQFNFAELRLTNVGGTVYVDRNANGSMDATPTDGRLSGVTVRLVQGASCAAGTTLQTTTTAADGSYGFAGVVVGAAYRVCETQPVGYATGTDNPGAGAVVGAANEIVIASLPIAGSSGNNFGELTGSIAGVVFLDANNDGVQQGGEAGIGGVTVTLTGTDVLGASVSRSTTTAASGSYSFADLIAGSYTVTEQLAQPVVSVAGVSTTTLNGRSVAGSVGAGSATSVGTLPSAISAINLAAGAASSGNNFAEILPASIRGNVFIDLNNNGSQDLPGDLGLSGIAITLTGTDDTGAAVSKSLSTAGDGSYSATDLRPGTYTITELTQPSGTTNGITTAGSAGGSATAVVTTPSAISGVVLSAGAASINNNFAEIANNSIISGRVWQDVNDDGVIDSNELGIAGVTIQLTGTDRAGVAISKTTTTDAQGRYSFASLAPGTYVVTEPTQPSGTINGITRPGSSGGTATSVATMPSAISGIVLGVGQSSSGNDFGELTPSSIAGLVYADNNNNGLPDTGEAGLASVAIALTGTDDLGQTVASTTTTDATGRFSFANLRPGTYTVTEPTQPPGTVNGITSPGTIAGAAVGSATAPTTAPSAISAIVLPLAGVSVDNNFGEISNSPDLRVSKSHSPASLTVNNRVTATIRVRNVGELPTTGSYTVSDRLPDGLPLAETPSGQGWSCTGAVGGSSFSCTSTTVVDAGATSPNPITVRMDVPSAALNAIALINAVMVEGGGEIEARRPSAAERAAFNGDRSTLPSCVPAITHNACQDAMKLPVLLGAAISGTAWYDIGNTLGVLDSADQRLPGWIVEIVDPDTQTVLRQTLTGADGKYRIADLPPYVAYEVRFRDPVSGTLFGLPVNGETGPGSSGVGCIQQSGAAINSASSCVSRTGANPVLRVVLAAGQELVQQSLPVDPSGVVYDALVRQPVPGAVVTLAPVGSCTGWNPALGILGAGAGGYTINGSAIAMTVGSEGLYQFFFTPSAPALCTYAITVKPPTGYTFVSTLIPPAPGTLNPPGGLGTTVAVQPQTAAPTGAVGPATLYYLSLSSGSSGASIIHNHIPLDPLAPTAITLSKTGDKTIAEIGDSVRYTITVQLASGANPRQVSVLDRLPRGLTYIPGTTVLDGTSVPDPRGKPGPALVFDMGSFPANGRHVVQYRARVDVGALQGDGINRARAYGCGTAATCVGGPGYTPQPGSVRSNEGAHQIRVTGGVFTTDACVLGKVFVDCNNNHIQDAEELGIPGVRLVMSDGTTLISDSEGKYSVCGITPRSHVLRVDPLTLPRGSRLTTSSNRNLGDAGSLWLDVKNGELHRADFIEGSCSNTVLEQVKARRTQGEVRAPEAERSGAPALRFDSKAHGLTPLSSPAQGTDGANQLAPKARVPAVPEGGAKHEQDIPTPDLPMNRPPPTGRDAGTAPTGGSDAKP